MSVVEVIPERDFYVPMSDDYESHLLARVNFQDAICLAGLRAVLIDGAPMLEWAVRTDSGIIHPNPSKKFGHLVTSEVAHLDFDPSVEMKPEEILELPRVETPEKLLWTPASLVYGFVQDHRAKLGYRKAS